MGVGFKVTLVSILSRVRHRFFQSTTGKRASTEAYASIGSSGFEVCFEKRMVVFRKHGGQNECRRADENVIFTEHGRPNALLEGSTVATLLFVLAKLAANLVRHDPEVFHQATAAAKGHLGSNCPNSSSAFGAELQRIAPQLRVHGISIHFERRREDSVVSLSVENGKTAGSKPSITDLQRHARLCCNRRLFRCNTVNLCHNGIYANMLKCNEYSAATP